MINCHLDPIMGGVGIIGVDDHGHADEDVGVEFEEVGVVEADAAEAVARAYRIVEPRAVDTDVAAHRAFQAEKPGPVGIGVFPLPVDGVFAPIRGVFNGDDAECAFGGLVVATASFLTVVFSATHRVDCNH